MQVIGKKDGAPLCCYHMEILIKTHQFTSLAMIFAYSLLLGGDVWANERDDLLSSSESLTSLARQYENAEGVPKDYQKALELYCQAARAGFADAQYSMGWMYANGRGVSKNDEIAAQFFQIAAEQGHQQAIELTRNISGNVTSSLPTCMTLTEVSQPLSTEALTSHIYPKGKISKLVEKLAPRYSIDPNLAMAIIYVESRFNERAISPKDAQGLMQLTQGTAERFSVKDRFNAEDNLKGGLSYLRWLLAFFRGNVSLVAAAYNAGERSVEKYHGVPPYLETRDYVKNVTALYQKATHPFQRNLVDSSSVVMRQGIAMR